MPHSSRCECKYGSNRSYGAIDAFQKLLSRSRVALMRVGGGDEAVVATVLYAIRMLKSESSRLNEIVNKGQDGTKRHRRKFDP